MEQVKCSGFWFFPEVEGSSQPGNLTFNKSKGIELEILEGSPDPRDIFNKEFHIPLITGISHNKYYTLYNCHRAGYKLASNGVALARYEAEYLLDGHTFTDPASICFNEFSLKLPFLQEWFAFNPFSVETDFDNNQQIRKGSVAIESMPSIVTKASCYTVSIDFPISLSIDWHRTRSLTQNINIRVLSDSSKHISVLRKEVLSVIRGFFAFAMQRAIWPEFILLKNKHAEEYSGSTENVVTESVLKFEQPSWSTQLKKFDQHDCLFYYPDIKDDFSNILSRWFLVSGKYEATIDQFFGASYNKQLFLNHEFLSLIHGIEAFHIDLIGSSKKEKLENRFREVFKYLGEASGFITSDVDSFVLSVVQDRHQFSHGKSLGTYGKDYEKLMWRTRQLHLMIEICLMKEIGLSLDTIRLALERNRSYQFLRSKIQQLFT